jgi:3',5'-cyclic AMP phosphodiesterase CpdA
MAKLAFCLPLHLLRCTTCSFECAHGHRVDMRGLEQTNGSCFGSASPSSRRNTGADLESYGQTVALRYRATCSGAEETRTPDFLLAKEALYQLSYGPRGARRILRLPTEGFESSARWAFVDSNHRPLPYQGSALTS